MIIVIFMRTGYPPMVVVPHSPEDIQGVIGAYRTLVIHTEPIPEEIDDILLGYDPEYYDGNMKQRIALWPT